jgi:23S rRNA pseudouridine1911/1915/1917 synthase
MASPYFTIPAALAGQTLAAVLRRQLSLSWSAARRVVEQRRVRLAGAVCADPARRVQRGQRVEVLDQPAEADSRRRPSRSRRPRPRQHGSSPEPVIRYADEHIVVVEKPVGLTTMRHPDEAAEFGARGHRFLPPTLADRLPGLLARERGGRPPRVRAVHRLDKETSGLVVFALTPEAEQNLGGQFRAHTIDRKYLAVVRGRARPGRIESFLVRDRGDGRRGSGTGGKRAVTHVRVVEELGAYTLVECRLETGRTHQVRIHLGESGTPICSERVYDRPLHGAPVPDESGVPRLALHAAVLGFEHPGTGRHTQWRSPLPEDLAAFVERLRRSR